MRARSGARPGYASSEDLPDEIVLKDGTIIRYVPLSEFLARRKAREVIENIADLAHFLPVHNTRIHDFKVIVDGV